MHTLRPFQRRFIRGALRPGIDTAALTMPRANGKSWIAAYLLARVLDPDDALFRAGTESVLLAGSIDQARHVFRPMRGELEPRGGYRWQDSANRMAAVHEATDTRLRVISSSGKHAMGLVGVPWAIADEPGAWETVGGELMHDALQTAQGKPGSPLKVIYIGTLAPARAGWWHDMIDGGSHGSVFVQSLRGDRSKWDKWSEIRRCNPLVNIDARFRRKLLEERDAARRDDRLKARFLSYRLNVPTAEESKVLLTVEDWHEVAGRPVPDPDGRPIVGVDLGAGRSFSAAVALWPSGRAEALAVAPGIPSIEQQERRDRVPAGTYRRLVADGTLEIAEGLRVQPPAQLVSMILRAWGRPRVIVCDRFRIAELEDNVRGKCPVSPRVSRWSEASEDIRALRKLAKDGPLAWDRASRSLVMASLAASTVKSDDAGNMKLVKPDKNQTARDDVAAALVLAAGQLSRSPAPRPVRLSLIA